MIDHEPTSSVSAVRVGLILAFIGLAAFGGPAAHVALRRRMIVERRCWVEPDTFNRSSRPAT